MVNKYLARMRTAPSPQIVVHNSVWDMEAQPKNVAAPAGSAVFAIDHNFDTPEYADTHQWRME